MKSSSEGYTIADDCLFWGNRKIARIDAEDFVDLGQGLARVGGQFWLNGAKITAPGKSFQVLGPNYACDQRAVYLIMERKLKPISEVTPDDFTLIGNHYAMSRDAVWYLDRRIRGLSQHDLAQAALRQVASHYLTDGKRLYFTTKQVSGSDKHGIDWHSARLRPLQDSAINPADIVIDDVSGIWLHFPWMMVRDWNNLGEADFEALLPLDLTGEENRSSFYHGDGCRIWYKGAPVSVENASEAYLIGPGVLSADGKAFHRDQPIRQAPEELHWIEDDLYLGPGGLWRLDCGVEAGACIARTSEPDPAMEPLAELSEQVMRAIFGVAFALFDELVDHRGDPHNMDLPTSPPFCDARLAFDFSGNTATITLDDQPIASGNLFEYYRLACISWARLHGREDDLIIFPTPHYMLPKFSAGRHVIMRQMWPMVIRLASGLLREGYEEDARRLAHEALYVHRYWGRGPRSPAPAPLADLAPELACEARYSERHYGFSSTANLAAAREVCASGHSGDADWRVRLEMIRVLTGIASGIRDQQKFQEEIVPQLIGYWQNETDPLVRECWMDVFEMAALRGAGDAWDISDGVPIAPGMAKAVQPLVLLLVDKRVNLSLNQARLAACT